MIERHCPTCKKTKLEKYMVRGKNSCRTCRTQYERRWRNKNRDKVKRTWMRSNDKKRDYIRNYYLLKKFGITTEGYNHLWKKQNGLCAICKKPETVIGGRKDKTSFRYLAVDHSHSNGHIRGLLCFSCNTALGKIESVENWYGLAMEYLMNCGPKSLDILVNK